MIEISITFYGSAFYIHWENKEKPHRLDGPAVIWSDGDQVWYKEGKRHRDDDKPAVIRSDGTKEWWKESKFIKAEDPDD